MIVAAIIEGLSSEIGDQFRREGWRVVDKPLPAARSVQVHDRLDEARIRDSLTQPWGGAIEWGEVGRVPDGQYLLTHLAAGGLALALRTDTAYGCDVVPLFAQAVAARLIAVGQDISDLEFSVHEMVTNALLHGNLGLASSGGDLDGLEAYGERLAEALDRPAQARRRLMISAAHTETGLEIAVEDEGDGFDHAALLASPGDPRRPHGLTLVSAMASRLRFERGGRVAVVTFPYERPRRGAQASPDYANAHVLVVDDNATNRGVMKAVLTAIGIGRVEMATNGAEGLAAIAEAKPDLVLLDVMMPQMDGFEMCRRLRRHYPLTELPVIFVTALNGPGDRAACFAAGASDWVSKPIDIAEMTARVGVHLRLGIAMDRLKSFQDRVGDELHSARGAQLALTPTAQQIAAQRRRTGLMVEGVVETCSELGGDFWTVFDAGPRRMGVLVADFSGHGPVAAFNVFRLHLLIARLPRDIQEPAALLEQLNGELKAVLKPGEFAAVFAGLIDMDKGTLSYAAAAAPPPVVLLPGQPPRFLDVAGPPLGAFIDAEYEAATVAFPPGSTLLAYSDALIESEVAGRPVCDDETLLSWLAEAEPGRCLTNVVLERFHDILPGEPPDDLTLVCVRRPA